MFKYDEKSVTKDDGRSELSNACQVMSQPSNSMEITHEMSTDQKSGALFLSAARKFKYDEKSDKKHDVKSDLSNACQMMSQP